MTVTITPLTERDFFAWYPLLTEYASGAGVALSDEHVMRVWTAVQAPEAHAAVARNDAGDVVGFVHAVGFERLLQGDGGYQLEDLYVTPAARGRGTATALVEHLRNRSEQEHRAQLRWAARADDGAAKALQQKFAEASGGWVLQSMPVG